MALGREEGNEGGAQVSGKSDWVYGRGALKEEGDPGIKLTSFTSPALVVRFFTTSATWEANLTVYMGPSFFLELFLH